MAITKMDEVLAAIQAGKTNDEIRDEIDGRLSDKRIDVLRAHPAVRGGSGVKNEIEREVEKIFSPSPETGALDEQAPAQSQISVRAGCGLGTEQTNVTSVTQTAGCDLRLREDDGSCLTREQRTEPERQLNGQTGAAAIRINAPEEEEAVKAARLKVVGVNLEGLLNYYVDKNGITFEADFVQIEAEQIGELLEELKRVSEICGEMKEAGA